LKNLPCRTVCKCTSVSCKAGKEGIVFSFYPIGIPLQDLAGFTEEKIGHDEAKPFIRLEGIQT
jgi:hypothetical protein